MSLVFTNLAKVRSTTGSTTFIRCYRKPRWIPTAKSKIHRNIELKKEPLQESKEKTRLQDNHRVYCKSLWAWQKQAIAEQMKHSGSNVQYNEELELRRIVQDNDKINVRVKSHRDEALVREWVQIVEEIGQQRLLKEDADDQRLEIAKKKMLSEMEKLKSIINLDDLDIAIEAALSSEVEYNFAIDASGSVIGGRND